ncbi:MAG: MATE family efflux transporter [Dorea sp.]|nr:MATE family efflux transporter [Dorea sp.]
MKKQLSQTNPITEGVIWKQVLIFFIPIALGTVFQQLYNVVDAAIVGRFVGKQALASVGGSAAMLTNIVVYFFSGLSTGAGVIISQYFGAKNLEKLHKSLHTAYAFSIVISMILAVIGWCITPWILEVMKTPGDVMTDSIIYLRIYFLGLIATLTYNMGSAIMRAVGDSRRPLYYLIVCSVLNVVLDVVFVVFFQLGIAGAAIATVISQAVCALIVANTLMNSYPDMKLVPARIGIDRKILWEELRVGLPGGLQFCISGVTGIILQTAINSFGTDTAAAWAAYNKMDMIFWTVCSAFGATVTTFVGQNYGAGKMKRVFQSIKICLGLALIVCGAAQMMLLWFCRPMFHLFVTDGNVIDIGVYMIHYLVPIYILFVFMEIPSGALRGLGDAAIPTAINLAGVFLVRVPWILLVLPKHHTLEVVMLSYPISGIASMILLIVYYFIRTRKIKTENRETLNSKEISE